jgi:signal transduction histidine kinase
LEYMSEHVRLTVSNPVPLSTVHGGESKADRGFGVAGMLERLQLAGGTLTAGLASGEWIVRADVPQSSSQ